MEEKKPNFGREKASKLLSFCDVYEKKDFTYVESMSVLKVYLDYNFEQGVDVSELQAIYDSIKLRKPFTEINAGVEECMSLGGEDQLVVDFIKSRHSIRSFENIAISDEMMQKIAELTNTAPSACNRQPSKIYYSNNKVKTIDKYIPGNKGFEGKIPNWALITTDRDMFTKPGYMQWYVNGGIFTAYFVQALQVYGVGSCVFQVPIAYQGVDELKKIFGIPDNEAIVSAIGFGFVKSKCNILASTRKPVSEVLFKID